MQKVRVILQPVGQKEKVEVIVSESKDGSVTYDVVQDSTNTELFGKDSFCFDLLSAILEIVGALPTKDLCDGD